MNIPKSYKQMVVYNNGEYICYKDLLYNTFVLYNKAQDKFIMKSKNPIKFDDKIYNKKGE